MHIAGLKQNMADFALFTLLGFKHQILVGQIQVFFTDVLLSNEGLLPQLQIADASLFRVLVTQNVSLIRLGDLFVRDFDTGFVIIRHGSHIGVGTLFGFKGLLILEVKRCFKSGKRIRRLQLILHDAVGQSGAVFHHTQVVHPQQHAELLRVKLTVRLKRRRGGDDFIDHHLRGVKIGILGLLLIHFFIDQLLKR